MINPHPGLPEFDYVKPKTLAEASQLLYEHVGEARPLLGGTDIFVRMRDGIWKDKYLVDVKGLEGMNEISFDPSKMPPALPDVVPAETDWPWWRGPNRDNISPATGVPTTWDENTNILWKSKIPGRGHASPTVWGDRIFLATAE